ncbi:hypothetical protein SAMN05421821_105293 [Mucilaginibacter lappiensis]|uniref:Uncharacterized protein n=1 Tax=Mucilaginibacter lappiensis TaxID=354630 RepID=A0ABR6PJC2_9SPHI|nr:hypothetical protein [Mucilaginibacter lappiensis]SIR18499.1 hypothetical protein SAMN05421821_105293 [Mucilaginibacter lappiensis]
MVYTFYGLHLFMLLIINKLSNKTHHKVNLHVNPLYDEFLSSYGFLVNSF